MRRTRCPWASSKGSTTRSASSNDGPTDFETKSTFGSKSSRACCRKSENRSKATHSVGRRAFKHSRRWIFPELDGFIRRRLRALLLKRARRRGTGHGLANRHWSNAFFAAHGLISLEQAHAQARQSSRR